ncbi:MAG: hypothetical protein PWR30_330 [Candidatus Woesearchaeota archaeon]|nr:hypothetical protein [Candidatus Woesearchaeota archaeon]
MMENNSSSNLEEKASDSLVSKIEGYLKSRLTFYTNDVEFIKRFTKAAQEYIEENNINNQYVLKNLYRFIGEGILKTKEFEEKELKKKGLEEENLEEIVQKDGKIRNLIRMRSHFYSHAGEIGKKIASLVSNDEAERWLIESYEAKTNAANEALKNEKDFIKSCYIEAAYIATRITEIKNKEHPWTDKEEESIENALKNTEKGSLESAYVLFSDAQCNKRFYMIFKDEKYLERACERDYEAGEIFLEKWKNEEADFEDINHGMIALYFAASNTFDLYLKRREMSLLRNAKKAIDKMIIMLNDSNEYNTKNYSLAEKIYLEWFKRTGDKKALKKETRIYKKLLNLKA